ncbi:MAG: hypothetical protein AB1646_09690 [Thermodesulfobacteriota bacterium]
MAMPNVAGCGKIRAKFLQAADAPAQGLLVEIGKANVLWHEREKAVRLLGRLGG